MPFEHVGLKSVILSVCVFGTTARAASLTPLASFNNVNGSSPYAGVAVDAAGNLYGTTRYGGSSGRGTIFTIAAGSRAITTLTSFGTADGNNPMGGVILDKSGDLYGTTALGPSISGGGGTVYKFSTKTSTLTTLHTFEYSIPASGDYGTVYPEAGLAADAAGNLYGTTTSGGPENLGVIYRIDAGTNSFTTLASFSGVNAGHPKGKLLVDGAGNLYGTTLYGGYTAAAGPSGAVFKLAPGETTPTVIASLDYRNQSPYAGLASDAAGNLYGTTISGTPTYGTVFEIDASTNALTRVGAFNGTNGAKPYGGVILDAAGNIYGTTFNGGANNHGTVFRIAAGTTAITTLASFDAVSGYDVYSTLTVDAAGNLYGTASAGGANGYGSVFMLSNTGFVVPEPAALGVIGTAAFLLQARRRRRA